ncbi:MAG TPA: methyltransferase domain-containing protein [Afifellaceae bacterium]|nr:methyltransferase domain-containing protein [Afifellaceae bacterium]
MTGIAHREDKWSAGDAYEPYVGRWSRLVAAEFLDWLALPADARWLDVGCGTGALSETILDRAAPRRIVGIDQAEAFIDFAGRRLGDPRATFRSGDAMALPVEDETFDVAVASLVLNFVADPAAALSEMRRAVRPGGTVAVYVWDYAGEMQLMRRFWDAAVALDPAARELDEGNRFPICNPGPLRALFAEAGLGDVQDRAIDVPTVFRDFDDYWSPFLGGQGPAPGYCVSLSEAKRRSLQEKLRGELPAEPDGKIRLMARAFAVRGVRPA